MPPYFCTSNVTGIKIRRFRAQAWPDIAAITEEAQELLNFGAMGTDKRERQKAARTAKREKEAAAAKRVKMIRGARRAAIIIAIIAVIMVILNLTADDASGIKPLDTTVTTADASEVDDEAPAVATTAATETTAAEAAAASFDAVDPECPATDGSGPVQKQFTGEPPMCIDADTTYAAVFDTTLGEITIALDQSVDMASVNNFIFLARHRYYEGVTFHRVIEDFMVQGGDPIGQPRGTGGPGYSFTGEQPDISSYPLGAFAMANTGNPSSNGSQFFIVTGANGQGLPNSYSLMGVVTDGLDIAVAISQVDKDPGDAPLDDVIINSVTIIEG